LTSKKLLKLKWATFMAMQLKKQRGAGSRSSMGEG
jgi:hypothetical protein